MIDALTWLETLAAVGWVSSLLRWGTLFVGIVFVYYVVYSLRRLRRTLHYLANSMQIVLSDRELQQLKRRHDAELHDAHGPVAAGGSHRQTPWRGREGPTDPPALGCRGPGGVSGPQ